ncbi:MAG: LPXTG cell wall anchor domain-containing protein [Clostridia bacterium]|nr:LPXTG cell wall anchor domain-containing protein [Clostridia bacterium]
MKKRNLMYSIIAIFVLIVAIVVGILVNKKYVKFSSISGKTQTALDGSETAGSDNSENYTYNTFGDDSANYVDGDINGEKSHWVKNGDTWTYTFYVDDPNAQWYIWEDSETLMDGYTGDYTESNVGTLFTEETLTEFTPDDSKMDSKEVDGKTVYTWLDNENAYKVIDNGDGTYKKVTTKLSFTITNTQDGVEEKAIEKGSLTINKVVKDSDGNELTENDDATNFQFTITLSAGTADSGLIEGTKIFGNVVFKNKVAKVALKAGGSVTISDLPAGVSYSITENKVAGYTTSYDSNSGSISKDTESTSTFTNKKIATPGSSEGGSGGGSEPQDDPNQQYVDITIKKAVTGNNEVNEEYTIEVELNNLTANKTYQLSNDTSFKSDGEGSANVSVKLSNNQSITLKDIPVGAKYKAFEYAGDYVSSYVITDSSNIGSIANTSNRNSKANTSLATATETADEGENVTITFTNKKTVTQNLKLAKTVTDNNDTNTYMFDIEFANMEENSSFNSTAGKVIADQNGKAELSVYLAGGEEVEFYDVPVGTTYRVKELASSAIASYTVVDNNGGNKIAKASDCNTTSRKALSTEIETVNQGEDVTVTFINDTVNLTEEESAQDSIQVSLGVTKTVVNSDNETVEDCEDTFAFELTANDESYPMPEGINRKSVTIDGNGTASFGTITFTKTGTYTYTVTEVAGNSNDYTYDTAKYTIVYEVINPEGLLEVTKTVKKNGFNSDVIAFTNKTDKYEKDEPGNSDEPENPDKPSSSDEEEKDEENPNKVTKDNDGSATEKIVKVITQGVLPKTGDFVVVYAVLAIIAIAGIAFIIIKKNKK